MLRFFKIVALLEGISLIVLFTNMLAIKPAYLELYKSLVFPIGMSHGLLFVGYIILATMLKFEESWSFKKYTVVCVASLLPFGTFYVEKKMLS